MLRHGRTNVLQNGKLFFKGQGRSFSEGSQQYQPSAPVLDQPQGVPGHKLVVNLKIFIKGRGHGRHSPSPYVCSPRNLTTCFVFRPGCCQRSQPNRVNRSTDGILFPPQETPAPLHRFVPGRRPFHSGCEASRHATLRTVEGLSVTSSQRHTIVSGRGNCFNSLRSANACPSCRRRPVISDGAPATGRIHFACQRRPGPQFRLPPARAPRPQYLSFRQHKTQGTA